jgi:hypothetical protein
MAARHIRQAPLQWLTSDPYSMNQKTSTEILRTHSERLRDEADERQQKRQLMLAEQSSNVNTPEVRVRAWERAHALRLPQDPAHPVLRSIARSTGLTLAQVQEEQRARRGARAPSAHTSPTAPEVAAPAPLVTAEPPDPPHPLLRIQPDHPGD